MSLLLKWVADFIAGYEKLMLMDNYDRTILEGIIRGGSYHTYINPIYHPSSNRIAQIRVGQTNPNLRYGGVGMRMKPHSSANADMGAPLVIITGPRDIEILVQTKWRSKRIGVPDRWSGKIRDIFQYTSDVKKWVSWIKQQLVISSIE